MRRSYHHRRRKNGLIVLLLMVGVVTGLSQTMGQENQEKGPLPEGAQYLPEGEGRGLMLKACVQCHDLRNTVSQRKTAAAWRRTINEMVWRGTPLVGDEANIITRYLEKSFGPDKPISPEQVRRIFNGERAEKASEAKNANLSRININTASLEDLMTLPGIGTREARAILEFRKKNGALKSVDDLDRIKAIAANVKRAIKKHVTVE